MARKKMFGPLNRYRVDTLLFDSHEVVLQLEDFLNELDGIGWHVRQVIFNGIATQAQGDKRDLERYMVISEKKKESWWEKFK